MTHIRHISYSVRSDLHGSQFTEDVHTHSAAVVDESSQVTTLGGVYDRVMVHSEQVAAPNALLCVPLLSIVCHHLHKQDEH